MIDEDEMEKFEITDFDLQNEFGFGRPRHKLTKEQQIYGVWAQSDDEDDEERSSRHQNLLRQPQSLKQGLKFVAGGVQESGKKDNDKGDKAQPDDDDDDDDDQDDSQPSMFPHYGDSSDDERNFRDSFPTSFGTSSKKSAELSSNRVQSREIAGLRRNKAGTLLGSGIGDWEKHTTGVGSKIMKMMGYEEGKGLGKNLQGISTPVEASKRKGKGAIGYYGSEKPDQLMKVPTTVDSEDEDKKKFREQLQQWKKTGKKKKIKYVYKSAEDVIQEGRHKVIKGNEDSSITKTKVIDMTGPEMRVLSSYHAIAGQKTIVSDYDDVTHKKYENFDLPELIYNLSILLEKSEDDILRNARTMEREQDRIVHLNHERERYDELIEREEAELCVIDDAMRLIESLDEKHNQGTLTLVEAKEMFTEIKTNHSKIYYAYEIAYLAPTYLTPLLKNILSTWNLLVHPALHIDTFTSWRELVEIDSTATQATSDRPMDPYHQVLWDTWAGSVRSTVMGPWEPKDCNPLLTVFESWRPPLVPVWIQTHLLHNILLPRITKAVNNWSPMEDTVPIHTWLHPWLPMLSDQLQVVYPVIRQKLSSALIHWHPSDRSAKMVLQPWKGVFSEISMAQLIQSSIQPKLESALFDMPVTPHNQSLNQFHWFRDWEDMIPPQILLDILDRCFFPKWFQALGGWLSSNPPYLDVINWYKGWRDLMPVSITNHQQFKQKLSQAVEICKRALGFQVGALEQFNLLLVGLDKFSDPPPPPPPGSPPKSREKDWAEIIGSVRRDNLTMREVVERRCQDLNILFVPAPEKNHEGRPVYRCGNYYVSFNKNVIYVNTERGWVPKSLIALLDEAAIS